MTLRLPLSTRHELLTEVLDDAPLAITVCPGTGDVAVADDWMADTMPIEGVMVKAARVASAGTRGRGSLKRRATHTIDCLIGGVTGTLARPRTLLLGRRIGARVSYVGHTTPLSDHASVDVAELLTILGVTEVPPMWPRPLPARWVDSTRTSHWVPACQADRNGRGPRRPRLRARPIQAPNAPGPIRPDLA